MSDTSRHPRAASPARRPLRTTAIVLAAALLAGGAGLAMANRSDEGHGGARHEQMSQRMAERMAEHQQRLKTTLRLKPTQEAAWQQFVNAMKPPATPPSRPSREEMSKLTTPERIDRMTALRAQRDAEMDQRAGAIKTFYAQLDAEQRKVFDAQPIMGMGGPGHGGKGGARHHGG